MNRKTGFPYSNSPPPLPPLDYSSTILDHGFNESTEYIYIYRVYVGDSTGTIGPFCPSSAKKMRDDAVRYVRPCFPPDVTNFERVFARFFIGRRVEGGRGAIVINRFCGGALRCKIPVVVAANCIGVLFKRLEGGDVERRGDKKGGSGLERTRKRFDEAAAEGSRIRFECSGNGRNNN